jgi:thiamine kinase-like enzyme
VREVTDDLDFLMDNRKRGCAIWDGMERGTYPTRVTHNDTKMNNVLFSEDGSEALCVIDLDTVMPGTICLTLVT